MDFGEKSANTFRGNQCKSVRFVHIGMEEVYYCINCMVCDLNTRSTSKFICMYIGRGNEPFTHRLVRNYARKVDPEVFTKAL